MIDIVEFLYRVAAEADPPAIYNRANTQDMEDYILPSDLVEAGSYLEDFAAMDPVVDLETLTGQG